MTRFALYSTASMSPLSNRLLVTLVGLCTLFAAQAAPPREAEREALRQAMQNVIDKSALKTARVTVLVRSLDDGTVVFSRDGEELLNPASNVKLYTSAASLVRLGPEYRFETEFLTDPDFKDGKAKTLFIRGKGDPTITTERLYAIVGELTHAGLTKELQDIVVDDSWFDAERAPPGFDQEYGDKAYLAPTGALSLNWNTVGVYLRPGEALGAKAAVELEPASEYFVLDADVSTGTKTQRRFTVSSALDKDKVHQKIEARGTVPFEKGSWSAWKKIDQPALYFGYTVKELLKQRGVKVKGRVRVGLVTPGQKMLHVALSETLDIVLKKLNKHSSNFVAEQLIKTLGAEHRGVPGSTEKGIDVVEDFLDKDVGLARGTYVMKNGSGLNDTNRFSAAQTTRLLVAMMDKFPLMPEYLSALGIAGKDGTLKYRFEGSDAVGRLRAKTGTLENVSALSGYVQAVGGERFVFSVMVNDFPGRAGTVVQYIDALGAAIAASSGTAGGPSAAALALTSPPTVVGPYEDLKARVKTYVGLSQKADRRNVAFLRTAWRTERDPAVRAIIADALYQSEPREPGSVRVVLDSAVASDDAFGRLLKAATELGYDTPVLPTLVELGASGNVEACSRLFEFVKYLRTDETRTSWLSEQLAIVANDAPQEVLVALHAVPDAERGAVVDVLVQGLVHAAQPQAPLWPTLRAQQGSADPSMAQFSRELEVDLSQKVAAAHAPTAAATPAPTQPPKPMPPPTTPPTPGG